MIARLQLLSTNSDNNLKEKEDEIITQKNKVIDEKESEISNKMQQLEELKMSKQKLVDLLKEKESESAKLTKMYMNLRNQRKNSDTVQSSKSSLYEEKNEDEKDDEDDEEESNTLVNDLYLENKFNLAENDFDTLSLDNVKTNKLDAAYKHSPSDYLWIEMKKQLNMRENLRSKKKELEDLIQNENGKTSSLLINSYMLNSEKNENDKVNDENKEDEDDQNNEENDKDYFEESNNNDIINGYREFFLRTKANSATKQEKQNDLNEKNSPKGIVRQKQENICPPEELIDDEIMRTRTENLRQVKQTEFENNMYLMRNDDFSKIDDNKIEGVLLKSYPEKQNQNTINDLSEKMDKFITNQQQLNESINKNFQEFLTKQNETQRSFHNSSFMNITPSNNNNNNDQMQFQTQIQIQQLMFNLNAAYHEISVQRNEMSLIKDNMKQMNARIEHLSSNNKTYNSIGTFTEDYKKDEIKVATTQEEQQHHPRSRSVSTNNALPSYFYNRKSIEKNDSNNNNRNNFLSAHQSTRHEAYYTDDFEEDEEEKRSNIINIKTNNNPNLNITRTFSSNTSSTSKKSTGSSSSIKNLTEFSSNNSSTFALNKNNNSLKSAGGNKSNEFLIQRLTRMQKLTSQTSTTSSQNEDQEEAISSREKFDNMREKIYSEVATLISKNEKRPVWLLNIFKELQYLNDKNSRDQALKSIFNISNRKISKPNSYCNSSVNLNGTNKPNLNKTTQNDNYDDDDDVITYNYRMKKSMEQDDDNSSSVNPFENDSLSNTVIFVKSSPSSKQTTNNTDNYNNNNNNNGKSSPQKQHNSSPVNNHNNDSEENYDEKSSISQEVKYLISKIISTIKFSSDDFESDDESGDDVDEPTKPYKYAKCDSQYLNNIVDKVLSVLRQSNRHFDYLRLYQNQLSSYLKEALNKYENKNLIDCMEDILIDISDILYNELTFYSIMNNSKLIRNNEFQRDESTSSLQSEDQQRRSHNLNIIKSLARNKINRNNLTEVSSRSNSLTTTTTEDDEKNEFSSEGTGEKVYYFDDSDEKLSIKASEMISKNAKASLDLLNRFKYLFKERNFNYLKACQDNDEEDQKNQDDNNQTDLSTQSTSSSDEENEEKNENITCKVVDINDIKVKEDDVTKLLSEKAFENNEIKIEDLPEKLDLSRLNAMKTEKDENQKNEVQTPFMAILDNIIMNSISDDLVGNPDEMPKFIQQQQDTNFNENLNEDENKTEEKNSVESARSQKSESSNSDHFVIIDGNNGRNSVGENNHSDPEIVDIKKEIEENSHMNNDENLNNGVNDASE